ncbi:MAG: DUF5333 domain-containing protein [Marinosulfonomonas sp.]
MQPKFNTTKHTRKTAALALCLAMMTGTSLAQDKLPLNQEEHIYGSLRSAAIGAMIEKRCPTISARRMLAIWKARALLSYAHGKGYSTAEVKAFVYDKAEQKRMRQSVNKYLRKKGAVRGEPETYCEIGRQEIKKGTLTGQLLRES